MLGVEITYADVCINALIGAFGRFNEESVKEMIARTKMGKNDTKGFDAIFESIIRKRILDNDDKVIFITEEADRVSLNDWPPVMTNPRHFPRVFISDPVDRSEFFNRLIQHLAESTGGGKIKELLIDREKVISVWESAIAEPSASITGATSAITYSNSGRVVFAVIFNFITMEIFVACEMGIYRITLTGENCRYLSRPGALEYIRDNGSVIHFPSSEEKTPNREDDNRFVTFLGKTMYAEIFKECNIMSESDMNKYILHREPGGPSRILYLSNLQPPEQPVGFILANGEKAGEWFHWLPFVKFSRSRHGNPALKAYEVFIEKAIYKDGILVSPHLEYSLFHLENGNNYIDISRFRNHRLPSRFRSIIVVAPADNEKIYQVMQRHNFREINACL